MLKLAAIALVLVACSKEDYKDQKPPEPEKVAPAEKKPPPPPKQDLKPEQLGSCELKATGAFKAEQTTPGGRPATNVSYWMTSEERGTMSNIDGFAINCHGSEIKFSILPGGGKKDGQPFQPKKYEFKKGAGDAGLMITFGPKLTLGDPTGTVDITTFDKKKIAGTINVSGKLVPGGGAVTLTGKFDFLCPGFAGCEI